MPFNGEGQKEHVERRVVHHSNKHKREPKLFYSCIVIPCVTNKNIKAKQDIANVHQTF